MKSKDFRKIKNKLEKELDAKRYEHTLGVEFTAAALAMRYDADIEKARLAGILHDCAKCVDDNKKIKICEKNHIEITDVEKRNPFLLHSKVGVYLAQQDYGIDEEDILNAILFHTTGRPDMSLLEKIIFIADYIEPGRKNAPNLGEVRKLAFIDLDKALVRILKDILQYLGETGDEMDPMTQKTYDYYIAREKN
jgi:predicted HD superfamily hydrolase involved in NAD metabolism